MHFTPKGADIKRLNYCLSVCEAVSGDILHDKMGISVRGWADLWPCGLWLEVEGRISEERRTKAPFAEVG